MRLPRLLTPHKVRVAYFLGEGPSGPLWGEPEEVSGVYVEDVQELVLDDSGAEIVSKGKVYFPPETAPTEGSRVTVWQGTRRERESTVVRVSWFDHPRGAPHAVAYLR